MGFTKSQAVWQVTTMLSRDTDEMKIPCSPWSRDHMRTKKVKPISPGLMADLLPKRQIRTGHQTKHTIKQKLDNIHQSDGLIPNEPQNRELRSKVSRTPIVHRTATPNKRSLLRGWVFGPLDNREGYGERGAINSHIIR